MEAIDVTARFDETGKVHPISLRWLGREYRVEAVGRRWQAEDGLHVLVICTTGQAFEIRFNPAEGRWYLVQVPSDRMLA
jgi:hypothetical protein